MSLSMLTEKQFQNIKTSTASGKWEVATADLVSTTEQSGRLTDLSLIVYDGKGKRPCNITANLCLDTENLLPSHVNGSVTKEVEVVYNEQSRSGEPPTIYGDLVALKCGYTRLHDFFKYD